MLFHILRSNLSIEIPNPNSFHRARVYRRRSSDLAYHCGDDAEIWVHLRKSCYGLLLAFLGIDRIFCTANPDLSKRHETMGNFNIWGDKRALKHGKNQWQLWACWCFFRLSRLENVKIDFIHSVELRVDTCEANWNSIYKYIKPE
jgi:hypothetical protein